MTIQKPDFDARRGTGALTTARLILIGSLCVFQYWLLSVAMEASHLGRNKVVMISAAVSVICFVISVVILLWGEKSKS